jgi:hypothetical protein
MTKLWQQIPKTHRRCGRCGKTFSGRPGLSAHLRDKHKVEPQISDFQPAARPRAVDREPSIADQVIEAIQNAIAGEPVDRAIEAMFPDEITEARRAR